MRSIPIPKLDLKGKTFDIVVPSSKSLANRALILAALSRGDFLVKGDFEAEDIQLMVNALRQLGIRIRREAEGLRFENDLSWMDDLKDLDLFLGNSGTSIRFLTSLVLLRKGSTVLTGKERMKERPIKDLVDALQQLGAEVEYLEREGFPPLRVKGLRSRKGGAVKIRGDVSSQFLTSILLIGSAFEGSLEIQLYGKLISKPYVDMTIHLMRKWDVSVQNSSEGFRIFPHELTGDDFHVEGDASAATYWWALAYLHDCVINVKNVQNESLQGDVRFKEVLNMLAKNPKSFEIDMNDMPDAAMTLMAVAPFHSGTVLIRGLESLRVKETDRIDAMVRQLSKCHVSIQSGPDWVRIEPFSHLPLLNDVQIETYDDHRIAMSMAVFGSRLGGIDILEPDCVRKTYPDFWTHFSSIH